jgi:hypothetical protein
MLMNQILVHGRRYMRTMADVAIAVSMRARRCGHGYISCLYYKRKRIEIKCEDIMPTRREPRNCWKERISKCTTQIGMAVLS